MEYITKQQVILICLLVALVTSIATAITVVSLTDQTNSPTETVYRVIENSIAKVADIPPPSSAPVVSAVSTPTTLSPADIAQAGAKSLVRIYDTGSGAQEFAALGVAVGTKGGILASALQVPNAATSTYIAVAPDGSQVPATFVKDSIAGSFAFFTLNYGSSQSKVTPIDLGDISGTKLGDNVVALGGKESGDVVSTGIVSAMEPVPGDTSSASSTNNVIITDMTLSSVYSGFLLFDTSGNLIAIEEGIDDTTKTPLFLNAKVIETSLAGLL